MASRSAHNPTSTSTSDVRGPLECRDAPYTSPADKISSDHTLSTMLTSRLDRLTSQVASASAKMTAPPRSPAWIISFESATINGPALDAIEPLRSPNQQRRHDGPSRAKRNQRRP